MTQSKENNGTIRTAQKRTNQLEQTILEFLQVKNGLLQANKVLLNAMDQMPVGVLVTRTSKNRIMFANPELHRMLGLTSKPLAGSTLKEAFFEPGGKCYYPNQPPSNKNIFLHHKLSDQHFIAKGFEALIHQPGGDRLYVIVNSSPVLDEQKKLIAMVSILQDITERKKAEESRQRNEERLNYALTASVDGLWDWDIFKDRGYLSPRYLEIYGYAPGELPDDIKYWAQMLHPDDKSAALAHLVDTIRNKKDHYESVYRLKVKGGSYRWIRSRGITAEKDETGAIVRMVGTHQDITKAIEQQNALERSNERLKIEVEKQTRDLKATNQKLETILNASSESIWVCDGKGVVISLNRAAEEILGIKAKQIIGKTIETLVSKGMINTTVTSRVMKQRDQVSMMQTVNKTNKKLLVTGTPVFDENNDIVMVIVNERDLTQLNHLKEELEQVRIETDSFKNELTQLNLLELKNQDIIAVSKEMREILATALKLAALDISNILILGESGTGKGLLAKFFHNNGQRRKKAFIQINCAALPETLLEAELFGYEKGAFTGASDKGKIGLFEMAREGTLFLDEIGELSMKVQAKLLKCLEDKEIMHLGGLKTIKTDCTVIAATNHDLEERVKLGKFRQDLFYRLNVFTLKIPPLRNRPEDIMELALFFLEKYNKNFGFKRSIPYRKLEKIQAHSFPGNVRELKNKIKKAVVMGEDHMIDNPLRNRRADEERTKQTKGNPPEKSLNARMMEVERNFLLQALETSTSTRALAAFLQTSQTSVVRKLKKHGLNHMLERKQQTFLS